MTVDIGAAILSTRGPAGGRGRASQPGVQFRWVRNNMPPYVETLTAILSSAAAYEARSIRRRRPARPTRPVLAEAEASLAAALKLVDDRRVAAPPEEVPTDDDLLRLDATAMQELMKGELGRIRANDRAAAVARSRLTPATGRAWACPAASEQGQAATPALRLELYHGALFPAPGQALHPRVFDGGDTAGIAPSDAVRSDPDVDARRPPRPAAARRQAPPPRSGHARGVCRRRRHRRGAAPARGARRRRLAKQRERLQFFNEFLSRLQNFEPRDVDGPREILCRRMLCVYKRKAAIGRLCVEHQDHARLVKDQAHAPSACRARRANCAPSCAPASAATTT